MLVQRKSDSSGSATPEETLMSTPSDGNFIGKISTVSPRKIKRSRSVEILANEPTDDEETILPPTYQSQSRASIESENFSTTKNQSNIMWASSEETSFTVHSVEEAIDLLRGKLLRGEGGIEWNYENFAIVDHQLRLHIDMNVLKESDEHFEFLVKVRIVPEFSHSGV